MEAYEPLAVLATFAIGEILADAAAAVTTA